MIGYMALSSCVYEAARPYAFEWPRSAGHGIALAHGC
nr:MAG TPA: hypothetical protein [Caudoviricetes sp.]